MQWSRLGEDLAELVALRISHDPPMETVLAEVGALDSTATEGLDRAGR